jgi:hypothetical protein
MIPSNIPRTLSTRRLFLRSAAPGDGAAVCEAVTESLSALRAWPTSLPWALYEPSVAASERFCCEASQAFDARQRFAFLAFQHDGRLIGSVGLHDVRWDLPSIKIGFWMRSSAHRQGYAAESVRAVLDFASQVLGAQRIQAQTDEDNLACRATCEASKMRLEGILRNTRITPSGQIKNGCMYAFIPREKIDVDRSLI